MKTKSLWLGVLLLVAYLYGCSDGEQTVVKDVSECDGQNYSDFPYPTPYDGCTSGAAGTAVGFPKGSSPTADAIAAMDYARQIAKVDSTDSYTVIRSNDNPPNKGIIIVPGGNVDHVAYIPFAMYLYNEFLKDNTGTAMIAVMRYPASVYPDGACNVMTADFSQSAIEELRKTYSNGSVDGIEISSWALAGHSEGGVGASLYLQERINDEQLKGIVFLASYPFGNLNGIRSDFCTLAMAGGKDLVLDFSAYEAAKNNSTNSGSAFPRNTYYYDKDTDTPMADVIHSYMGSYCPLTPEPKTGVNGELFDYELYGYPPIQRSQQEGVINYNASLFLRRLVFGPIDCSTLGTEEFIELSRNNMPKDLSN